jgi:hypothetical protein
LAELQKSEVTGRPVRDKPLGFLGLSREDYTFYTYNLQDFRMTLDTLIVGEIIANSTKMDHRQWRPHQMRKAVLIKNERNNISARYVKKHFAHLPSEAISYYLSQKISNRNLYEYSRPVFSDKKKYAAIRYNSLHSYGVELFQFREGAWYKVAVLVSGGY